MSANPATTALATPSFTTRHRPAIVQAARYLGALSVLVTGVVHIQQYYDQDYSTIPTIGTLFFLNFVGAVVIAVGLIAPLGRVIPRHADAIRSIFAIGGIGLGVLSLAALFVSESSGLFGFVENGYRPAIVLAMVAEIAATLFLIVFLATNRSSRNV
jgi:predicted membrane protein